MMAAAGISIQGVKGELVGARNGGFFFCWFLQCLSGIAGEEEGFFSIRQWMVRFWRSSGGEVWSGGVSRESFGCSKLVLGGDLGGSGSSDFSMSDE